MFTGALPMARYWGTYYIGPDKPLSSWSCLIGDTVINRDILSLEKSEEFHLVMFGGGKVVLGLPDRNGESDHHLPHHLPKWSMHLQKSAAGA